MISIRPRELLISYRINKEHHSGVPVARHSCNHPHADFVESVRARENCPQQDAGNPELLTVDLERGRLAQSSGSTETPQMFRGVIRIGEKMLQASFELFGDVRGGRIEGEMLHLTTTGLGLKRERRGCVPLEEVSKLLSHESMLFPELASLRSKSPKPEPPSPSTMRPLRSTMVTPCTNRVTAVIFMGLP
jgi:hypothetical protein